MSAAKAHIIAQLKKDILLLEGFKPAGAENNDAGLQLIQHAFPNATFPSGALHEFICHTTEDSSASSGFIAALLSSLMNNGSPSVWIAPSKTIFPPALKSFGIDPHKIIFIQTQKPKEILWTIEEALKCDALCSVIGEINEISFAESRRLQLAMERSKATGFLIRTKPKNQTTVSVAKWMIKPLATEKRSVVPGLLFPRWNVDLVKVRNGKTGSWQMEWRKGKFQFIHQPVITIASAQRKVV